MTVIFIIRLPLEQIVKLSQNDSCRLINYSGRPEICISFTKIYHQNMQSQGETTNEAHVD